MFAIALFYGGSLVAQQLPESDTSVQDVAIYPNPVKEEFKLSFVANANGEVGITIFDITGKKLLHKSEAMNQGNNFYRFDTRKYNPGVYLVKIDAPTTTYTQKLIIKS